MDDFILRYPLVSNQIHRNLTNQELAICRTTSKTWCESIDNHKTIWFRRIKKYLPFPEEFPRLWGKVLGRISTETVQLLAYAIQDQSPTVHFKGYTPLHCAAKLGKLDIFLNIFQATKDINPKS